MNEWSKMCRLCGRKEQSPNCNNAGCYDDIIDNGHCRDKQGNAIPPIENCKFPTEDCEDHWINCGCELHDECACKNP